jgi:polysaccharide pyruvyl transferase WcaK-like protein
LTRIALLTPYNGSNLGDGTIQTAVIENLLRRDPALELLGITLDPADTTRRHDIPAFPITGLSVSSYSQALLQRPAVPPRSDGTGVEPGAPERPGRVRQAIKATPLLGRAAKFLVRAWRALRRFGPEPYQLWRSFQVVRGLDLLVVSGGGQLDEEFGGPWGHPYVLFRWAILSRLARTRLAFASVGTQYMNRPLTRFFLRTALASAAYRSYRDPGSKQQVARWGFTKNDPVVPDLAFSLRLNETSSGRHIGEGSLVGLSPIVYGHAKHWPTKRMAVYEEYARQLAAFAHWLLERGHRLLLFQSSGADRIAVADLKKRLLDLAGAEAGQRIIQPAVQTVEQFFREVAAVDCVVASRLHGVLMSHMLCKPVQAISFDRKVDAHMEMMDQSRYCVDIQHFNAGDLIERFKALERNAHAERETITARVSQCRSQLAPQYDTLLELASRAPVRANGRAIAIGSAQ